MTPFCHRHPVAVYLISLVAALLCALAAPEASAQVLKEPALDALYTAERFDELDRLAQARLAQRADDAQAVLAAALVALSADDSARRSLCPARAGRRRPTALQDCAQPTCMTPTKRSRPYWNSEKILNDSYWPYCARTGRSVS